MARLPCVLDSIFCTPVLTLSSRRFAHVGGLVRPRLSSMLEEASGMKGYSNIADLRRPSIAVEATSSSSLGSSIFQGSVSAMKALICGKLLVR